MSAHALIYHRHILRSMEELWQVQCNTKPFEECCVSLPSNVGSKNRLAKDRAPLRAGVKLEGCPVEGLPEDGIGIGRMKQRELGRT
jgi:hypothetical protein